MDTADPIDPFDVWLRLRRELVAENWKDRGIVRMLQTGAWHRPRRGAYVESSAWKALDAAGQHVARTRAAIRAAKTEVAVSHASAAVFHGGPTWGLDLTNVHLTRRDGKVGRDEAGIHQHCGVIEGGDLMKIRGFDVVSPARVALEVSTMAPLAPGLAVLNDFLHRGLTTAEEVRRRYDAGIVHWPDSRVTELVVRMGDPRIESVLETRIFVLCREAGLPAPVLQYEVVDPATGQVFARLDFCWPDLGAWVEADGKVKYTSGLRPGQDPAEVVFREKRREDRVRELTGFRLMRLVWSDLSTPEATKRRLRNLLYPGQTQAS